MTRITILVVAYNAETKLVAVLDRIPHELVNTIEKVLVCDDASSDNTFHIGKKYIEKSLRSDLEIVRHPVNLGYGGNQKFGYQWAINEGFDIVVLLHGDGQYAPESLPTIIKPIIDGDADVVLGSRMLTKGGALNGGMPFYKFIGNKILTRWQNFITGTKLSEWHSGYRAYTTASLKSINFLENSDGFDFDTEILLQMNSASQKIVEVPIPTYYGDEICYVDGLKYARQVAFAVVKHRFKMMGFLSSKVQHPDYRFKFNERSSHSLILKILKNRKPGRMLDLGCAQGELSNIAASFGHDITAIDKGTTPTTPNNIKNFIQHDLESGLPISLVGSFNLVLCADVLEHLRNPDLLLYEIEGRLANGGTVLVSIPNFGHWYPRLKVLLGRFDYDARGILDQTHLRFFTRASFRRMATTAGFDTKNIAVTGTPFEVMLRGAPQRQIGLRPILKFISKIDEALCKLRPTLFAYQFIFELTPKSARTSDISKNKLGHDTHAHAP